MFLAYNQECWKVTKESVKYMVLTCNHKVADTRLSLHLKHAAEYRKQEISLISNDTDVMVLGISNSDKRFLPIFQKHGD